MEFEYDLVNFHGKWVTFAAEDRIQLCCPSVGAEYSAMKLCLLHDVDIQRQGNIKRQKVLHAHVLFVQLKTHCSVLLFIL